MRMRRVLGYTAAAGAVVGAAALVVLIVLIRDAYTAIDEALSSGE